MSAAEGTFPFVKGRMKPWMVKRAAALHHMCESIAVDVSTDVPKGKAYKRAQRRFNKTKIARTRGMHLCESAVRGHYAKWRLNPTPECFESRWGQGRELLVSPTLRRELALRAIHLRISIRALYERLSAEVSTPAFSYSTLVRLLPVEAIHAVVDAQKVLDSALQKVMQEIEAITTESQP